MTGVGSTPLMIELIRWMFALSFLMPILALAAIGFVVTGRYWK